MKEREKTEREGGQRNKKDKRLTSASLHLVAVLVHEFSELHLLLDGAGGDPRRRVAAAVLAVLGVLGVGLGGDGGVGERRAQALVAVQAVPSPLQAHSPSVGQLHQQPVEDLSGETTAHVQ